MRSQSVDTAGVIDNQSRPIASVWVALSCRLVLKSLALKEPRFVS